MSRQLVALVALLIVSGATLALRQEPDEAPTFRLDGLPALVDGWVLGGNASEETLPTDPRAVRTLRGQYRRGGDALLVSVARYSSWNHPDHRPLVHMITPARATGEMARETLPVDVAGAPGQPAVHTAVNVLSLQWRQRPLLVAYWYQLDGDTITGEYGLRLQLFVDTIRSRPRAVALIRLATDRRANLSEFLRVFYPRMRDLLVS